LPTPGIATHSRARLLLKYWLPVVVWLVLIVIFSGRGGASDITGRLLRQTLTFLDIQLTFAAFEQLHFVIRKTAHVAVYGLLGALLFRAIRAVDTAQNIWRLRWVLMAAGVALLTSAADEINQALTRGRTGSWKDVVLDMTGMAVFQIVIWLNLRSRAPRAI
jgi:VanZ family protein